MRNRFVLAAPLRFLIADQLHQWQRRAHISSPSDSLCMCGAATVCTTSIATFATTCAFKYRMLHLLSLSSASQVIRFQTKRYDLCCTLFKELIAHELKYNFTFDDQSYAFMIDVVLKLPPTAAVRCYVAPLLKFSPVTSWQVLRMLTREQVMTMVMASLLPPPQL